MHCLRQARDANEQDRHVRGVFQREPQEEADADPVQGVRDAYRLSRRDRAVRPVSAEVANGLAKSLRMRRADRSQSQAMPGLREHVSGLSGGAGHHVGEDPSERNRSGSSAWDAVSRRVAAPFVAIVPWA